MKNGFIAAALALGCLSLPAQAVDGVAAEAGRGNGTDMWRVGVQWDWDKRWLQSGNWHLGAYWDLQLGQWSGKGKNTITDVGFTPVFRFQQTRRDAISPYVEGGIGFHLISKTRLDEDRAFGSAFQFGDHIGAGVRFGERGRYDLGIRLQHLSNGGLKPPNDGINFTQLRFQVHLD